MAEDILCKKIIYSEVQDGKPVIISSQNLMRQPLFLGHFQPPSPWRLCFAPEYSCYTHLPFYYVTTDFFLAIIDIEVLSFSLRVGRANSQF
jgi:hypothetical protein